MALAANRDWETEELKWNFLLKAGRGFGFEYEPGKLGGVVLAICYPRIVAIGMLVVHQRCSRRGNGRRLLETVFTRCPGEAYMLFATEQGEPLYENVGFRNRGPYLTYRGVLASRPDDGVVVIAARDASPEITEAIFAADGAAFGDNRAVFLQCLMNAATSIATQRTGADFSFGIAWKNNDSVHIGPLVARDDDAALAIVHALASAARGRVRIDFCGQRTELAAVLRDLGLTQTGSAPLMTFGNSELVYPGGRLYSPALLASG